MLRFPDGMRERLKNEAAANNRSMNAEIVARLEQSFIQPVNTDLVSEVALLRELGRSYYQLQRLVNQIRAAERTATIAYEQLQRAHAESADTEELKRLKSEYSVAHDRAWSLEAERVNLEEHLNNLHFERRLSGQPELRDVTSVQSAARVGWHEAGKPKAGE